MSLIEYYLSVQLFEDAHFLGERLIAAAPTDTNKHLVATAYVHAGKWRAASILLQECRPPAAAYLHARCLVELGEFAAAEDRLLDAAGLKGLAIEVVMAQLQANPYQVPHGAAGAYILGVANLRQLRQDIAAKYFMLALYLDPFCFSAFDQLCRLGFYPDPSQTFVSARLSADGHFVQHRESYAMTATARAVASANAPVRVAGTKRGISSDSIVAAGAAGGASAPSSDAAASQQVSQRFSFSVAAPAATSDDIHDAQPSKTVVATAVTASSIPTGGGRVRGGLVVPTPVMLSPITPAGRLSQLSAIGSITNASPEYSHLSRTLHDQTADFGSVVPATPMMGATASSGGGISGRGRGGSGVRGGGVPHRHHGMPPASSGVTQVLASIDERAGFGDEAAGEEDEDDGVTGLRGAARGDRDNGTNTNYQSADPNHQGHGYGGGHSSIPLPRRPRVSAPGSAASHRYPVVTPVLHLGFASAAPLGRVHPATAFALGETSGDEDGAGVPFSALSPIPHAQQTEAARIAANVIGSTLSFDPAVAAAAASGRIAGSFARQRLGGSDGVSSAFATPSSALQRRQRLQMDYRRYVASQAADASADTAPPGAPGGARHQGDGQATATNVDSAGPSPVVFRLPYTHAPPGGGTAARRASEEEYDMDVDNNGDDNISKSKRADAAANDDASAVHTPRHAEGDIARRWLARGPAGIIMERKGGGGNVRSGFETRDPMSPMARGAAGISRRGAVGGTPGVIRNRVQAPNFNSPTAASSIASAESDAAAIGAEVTAALRAGAAARASGDAAAKSTAAARLRAAVQAAVKETEALQVSARSIPQFSLSSIVEAPLASAHPPAASPAAWRRPATRASVAAAQNASTTGSISAFSAGLRSQGSAQATLASHTGGASQLGAPATSSAAGSSIAATTTSSLDARLLRGQAELLSLLRVIGFVHRHVIRYEGDQAIAMIKDEMPAEQAASAYGRWAVGRAHLDRGNHRAAVVALRAMAEAAPHRIDGLELLSTALWHARDVPALTALARSSLNYDRRAWQAWVIAGNAASARDDHTTAVSCFRRAITLSPYTAYPHFLAGMESMAAGMYEAAGEHLRASLRRGETRHYMSWHGLGLVYLKTGKLDPAEYHFKRAAEINRHAPLVHAYYATTLAMNNHMKEALAAVQRALALDPAHPQALIQRASIYTATGLHVAAAADLRAVHEAAPREASVLVQLGRAYQRGGDLAAAARAWHEALTLLRDDKAANNVQSLLDSLHVNDESTEGELHV